MGNMPMKPFRSKIKQLAKEIHLIASTDPAHRISKDLWPEAKDLIRAVNQLADQCPSAGSPVRGLELPDIKESEEDNILAAFISEMPEGVLICNAGGQILLFNRRARQLLSIDDEGKGPTANQTLALGRSITTVVDKNLIEHALEEINERLNRKVLNAVSHFVFEGKDKHILRSRVVPILTRLGRFTGFILTLNDITDERASDNRVESILQSLTKSARSPLASIRAASEAMVEYPDMDQERLNQFKEIIYQESIVLSDIINKIANDYSSLKKTKQSLAPVSGAALVETLRTRAREKLGVVVHMASSDVNVRVKADTYSILMAFLFILNQLKDETDHWEFHCKLQKDQKFASFDLLWPGSPVRGETVRQWEDQYLVFGEEKSPLTLKEVLTHHEAALVSFGGGGKNQSCMRILLPVDERIAPETVRPITILPASHGEFYDLDLMGKSGRNADLDSRLLTELGYTVLIRKVSEARRIEEILDKHSRLSELMRGMIAGGAKVRNLTRLITTFSDAVLKKTIGFAIKELGPPPVPFAFMIMGSEGRKEQTLKTDQDNAIIYKDIAPDSENSDADIQSYFLKLGDKVCAWLDRAGYDFCKGGVMAKNPKWCRPLSTWKKYFSHWIHAAEPEDLLHASIFFDFNFAYGDPGLVESLSRHMFDALSGWTGFFRNMAENAIFFKPPLGFFGNFVVASKGEYRGCLDIKLAMLPIVDFARIYALKNTIKETNTQERLYHLYLKKVLSHEEYNEIEQAYDFMMQIRFAGQIRAVIEENANPDNYINPKKLSTIEQKMLKQIFKRVERIQAKLNLNFPGAQESP